jgi:hypothetical protein
MECADFEQKAAEAQVCEGLAVPPAGAIRGNARYSMADDELLRHLRTSSRRTWRWRKPKDALQPGRILRVSRRKADTAEYRITPQRQHTVPSPAHTDNTHDGLAQTHSLLLSTGEP